MTSKVRAKIGNHMRSPWTLCASLLLMAAFATSSAAQTSGDDVTVNSSAVGRGYLLYPGGQYGRGVGPLLQPGEKPGAVIHLHMPTHRHKVVTATASAPVASPPAAAPVTTPPRTRIKTAAPAPMSSNIASLPEDSAARLVGANTVAAPPAKPARAPRVSSATTAAPPATNTGATTVPFSFGGETPAATPAPPARTVRAVPPPTRTASATPPARTTPSPAAGLKRQTVIPFASGATSLAPADVNAIHTLAATLTSALSGGASRVELEAFGGPRGDKSSDSRRLSLKRALVIRELLIEDGVPSERIDVRAMGGADDNGAADRVDVFLRG